MNAAQLYNAPFLKHSAHTFLVIKLGVRGLFLQLMDHRVKFLKTFEYGAQRGEGYRGESALLCSQFGTQY